jgi:hypothetical protein
MQNYLPILTTALIAAAASGVTVLAQNVSSLNLGYFAPVTVAALGALAHHIGDCPRTASTDFGSKIHQRQRGVHLQEMKNHWLKRQILDKLISDVREMMQLNEIIFDCRPLPEIPPTQNVPESATQNPDPDR